MIYLAIALIVFMVAAGLAFYNESKSQTSA
jgi:Ni,Fe-hydrogenase I cytochrome b subunit